MLTITRAGAIAAVAVVALTTASVAVHAGDEIVFPRYRVTIQNLTDAQPLSPPIVAIHRPSIEMFSLGSSASPLLEAIAEDGNAMPMFDALSMLIAATDAQVSDVPLTPSGTTVGAFDDAVEIELTAGLDSRLSMATMLICTNDGFTGLDTVRLPILGSTTRLTRAYDAGTEENTELSMDIVDPCSALGPVVLDGDPNGNIDDDVDSLEPRKPVGVHPGIDAIGDLLEAHDWDGPITKVTVTRLDPDGVNFRTPLASVSEVPPVASSGRGSASMRLGTVGDRRVLNYTVRVRELTDVVAAHIHLGSPAENGPPVAFLYGPAEPQGAITGLLADGDITEGDLVGPLAGDMDGFIEALRDGRTYVNVHTAGNPGGEIRGQIGAQIGYRPQSVRPDILDRPGARLPGR